MRTGLLLMLCACHARLSDAPSGDDIQDVIDAQPSDAIDAAPAPDALVLGAWGAPVLIPGASTTVKAEDDCTMSSSTNELVFAVVEGNAKHLWMQTRTDPASPWGAPVRVAFNGPAADTDQSPRFSPDDLTLFFGSNRPGGKGGGDIWKVTRQTVGGAWSAAADATDISTASDERWFTTCDGTHYMIVVNAGAATGFDLFEGTIGTPPTPATELNSSASDTSAFLTTDCLTVFYASTRNSITALYTATRTAIGATWTTPTVVTDFGLAGEQDPWMSPDQRTFIFASDSAGTNDIYISTR
jgi:hypothetical protein